MLCMQGAAPHLELDVLLECHVDGFIPLCAVRGGGQRVEGILTHSYIH